MSLPKEIDDYIKESIDHMLGLPVSTRTLESKLAASEDEQRSLQAQCLSLHSKLNQHILATESAKAEAKLSAQGLKKAIQTNQHLSEENSCLVAQCNQLKAYLNSWKLALSRGKEAEHRVRQLEDEVKGLTEDLNFFKEQHQLRKFHFSSMEEVLVESALSELVGEIEFSVGGFLLANMEHESCRRLLHLSQSLQPSTLRALSLTAKVKALEQQNEHLHMLLSTAEGEVKLLSNQIGYLLADETSSYEEDEESSPHPGRGGSGKPPISTSPAQLHEDKRVGKNPSNSEE